MGGFSAVLFDFIGTTVFEQNNVIEQSFQNAFLREGLSVESTAIRARRGLDKHEAIHSLLLQHQYPREKHEAVMKSFTELVLLRQTDFKANPDAIEIFSYLKARNVRCAIGTGLPRSIFQAIMSGIHWRCEEFDYVGIASEIGRGRPYPDMIFNLSEKLNVGLHQIIKVGDTVADIQEGQQAGVYTIALSSNTLSVVKLREAKPNLVITSLLELKNLI